jgi:hypothetical protein
MIYRLFYLTDRVLIAKPGKTQKVFTFQIKYILLKEAFSCFYKRFCGQNQDIYTTLRKHDLSIFSRSAGCKGISLIFCYYFFVYQIQKLFNNETDLGSKITKIFRG